MKSFILGLVFNLTLAGATAWAGGYFTIDERVRGSAHAPDGQFYSVSGQVECDVEVSGYSANADCRLRNVILY